MTSTPPAPISPADLPIRRLTLADLPACLDLSADRSWPREEHKWRLLLTAGQGYGIDAPPGDPAGGLIACLVVTSYAADHRAIGMVLVAERHARRGIGRRLMRHALAECAPAAVFLTATDNGRPLYEQLGFKSVGAITTLRGPFTGTLPAAPGSTVRPATAADLPGILAYDLPIFGADRTELLTRLPSFADHILVAEAPGGGLAGYGASWPNVTTTVIGPVLADDLATAQALIAELAARAPLPVRFDVDDRHRELAAWLRASGLTGDSRCALMVLGAPDLPGDATRRFAPYSVALG
ncbi:GNAT family N-acetyltransferase [Streptomyces litchfieldiae]|uniref:GNAT family N-acetyltransferase n=1 Tax=Streptomyces litchfieldiae TaxID=3075543 RepID=A0ABU2MKQ7_9ACTN|nr:GNAT family N-acetyltransferase [Streptomyces sp. DSM 44938]MDT0342191.1 GNAT family N-acetyltransferase [Streptomyces sp. DSM 44938]